MRYLLLVLLNISVCSAVTIKCDTLKQYNESTDKIETVKRCWDTDAQDYDECDTITETIISSEVRK